MESESQKETLNINNLTIREIWAKSSFYDQCLIRIDHKGF